MVMTLIGEDSSERLNVIPVQYRVIVTRRPKFACRACEGIVVQQAAPVRLIEGGIPTDALVAHRQPDNIRTLIEWGSASLSPSTTMSSTPAGYAAALFAKQRVLGTEGH